MTSPITAAALLLADKRVAVTLWAEVHKSNWSNILNIFQVVVTKTYIQRNLISVRESINIFVVKVISDGHSCFISGLLGTLHFAASCGIFFFVACVQWGFLVSCLDFGMFVFVVLGVFWLVDWLFLFYCCCEFRVFFLSERQFPMMSLVRLVWIWNYWPFFPFRVSLA